MLCEKLTFIGSDARGGTYVLRVRLCEATTLAFGNFKKGKLIHLAAGEYVYVGSALSERGATCLARRLVRHASRTGNLPPHEIQNLMIEEFSRRGMGTGQMTPRMGKHLLWNVDYVLDLETAELVAAIVIRSPLRLEAAVGRLLMADPASLIFEPGLGANDIPGNTHLLRVEADDAWWQALSMRLQRLMEDTAALNGACRE